MAFLTTEELCDRFKVTRQTLEVWRRKGCPVQYVNQSRFWDLDAVKTWMETTKELYGEDGDVFEYRDTERLWCYIPHFHDSFYVYAYACGEFLAQSLYAVKDELGDRFEPTYLDSLRSGETKNMKEFVAPYGKNPEDPDFWANGIRISLGTMVDEIEALARKLGLIP